MAGQNAKEAGDHLIEISTSADFPLVVEFKKSHEFKNFAEKNELEAWLLDEESVWSIYASGSSSLTRYLRDVQNFRKSTSDKDLKIRLISFAEHYVPAKTLKGLYELSKEIEGGFAYFEEISRFMLAGRLDQLDPRIVGQTIGLLMGAFGIPVDMAEGSRALRKEAQEAVGIAKKRAAVLDRAVAKTEERLKEIENTFLNQYATKAPKEFWEERALIHQAEAKYAGRWWILSVIVLISVFLGIAYVLSSQTPDVSTEGIIVLLRNILLIGSAISLIVWVSRTKLRDRRIHDHLATDANERVTMIQTYNVLKQAGLEGADLSNILAALYRPVTTGLVDDSGPTLPMEILIKQAANLQGKVG